MQTQRLRGLVLGLGLGQIISWGQLYYSIAVLWPPIAADLALSQTAIYGVVSLALLLNGLMLPISGNWIDRLGGRPVMMLGSILASLSLCMIAMARGPVLYVLGWSLGGIAMAMTLYDPAFATLSQHSGARHRRALTAVTLLGGLASTVFWPLTAWLLQNMGWRAVLGVFALMQLLICLPLHAFIIPRRPADPPAPVAARQNLSAADGHASPTVSALSAGLRATYVWLGIAFMLHAFAASLIAVNLLALLQHRGLSLAQAVAVGMAIGPAQVAGRLIDFAGGDRVPADALALMAFALITLAMLAMQIPDLTVGIGLIITVFWGLGNGLITIARGIIVAERFPRAAYGSWMGRLSRISFIANAFAPALFALALAAGLPEAKAGWLLAAATFLGLLALSQALRRRDPG